MIPSRVGTERFNSNLSRQQAREQLNWPQERIILFIPRRLLHRMGLDKLLSVITLIKPHLPDLWLAVEQVKDT